MKSSASLMALLGFLFAGCAGLREGEFEGMGAHFRLITTESAEANAFLRVEERSFVHEAGDSAHALENLRKLDFADFFRAVLF